MTKQEHQNIKITDISIADWNNILNNDICKIQPLIFGYKVQIKNDEIFYKQQKINLVNRLLNRYIDKLYIESIKIKRYFRNCFVILFEDKIFIDVIDETDCNDVIVRLGYYPINTYDINKRLIKSFKSYDEIELYLYNSTNISDDFENTVFGFKIFQKYKNNTISVRIKEKEKEKFVVNDFYKFYYKIITSFIFQEFKKYPNKYNNNIKDLDKRIIWTATELTLKIALLESTFNDEHLKKIIEPFENNINYDKLPDIISQYGLTSLYMIILSILHNKIIKSGFIKSDLKDMYWYLHNFLDESYCKHMYFVDKYKTLDKF